MCSSDLWRPFLHDIGTFEVKHGLRVNVTNLYSDEVGNPNLPGKLRAIKKRHAHAALDVFLHSESANSNAAEALRLTGYTHQLIAAPVGQTDIGDKDVKRFTTEQLPCVRHAGGGANAEPILSKNGRKHAQGIGMVFHQKHTQIDRRPCRRCELISWINSR